jgi:hypothetical protein
VFCWTESEGPLIGVTQAFLYADGVFRMCAEASRAPTKAIRRDPRSSVPVLAARRSETMSFKGTSEMLDDRDTILWGLREVARRYDPDDPQAREAHVAAADQPGRVVIKFTRRPSPTPFGGGLARTGCRPARARPRADRRPSVCLPAGREAGPSGAPSRGAVRGAVPAAMINGRSLLSIHESNSSERLLIMGRAVLSRGRGARRRGAGVPGSGWAVGSQGCLVGHSDPGCPVIEAA